MFRKLLQKLILWLKNYSHEIDMKNLGEDARVAGKALLGAAFAILVYPRDANHFGLAGVMVLSGFIMMLFGLKKRRD